MAIGLSATGSQLFGGGALADQVADETEEQRKRRLAQMQLLPGASATGRALGLTVGGGLAGGGSAGYGSALGGLGLGGYRGY